MARKFQAKVAKRQQVKLKIGVAGPAGSGKTTSALLLAYGLTGDWSKIAVLDTENESSLYNVGATIRHGKGKSTTIGSFMHVPFDPPYSPQEYCEAMAYIRREHPEIEVLVIDSTTHEWSGEGGALDIAQKKTAASRSGNSYTVWREVTPMHREFIDTMREMPIHVIATMRSKQEYVQEKDGSGKTVIRKVGLKSEQRDGTDYEFGLVFDVSMEHTATAGKDRTGMFANAMPFTITPETGQQLLAWAQDGDEVKQAAMSIATPTEATLYERGNQEHVEMIQACLDRHGLDTDWRKANARSFAEFLQGRDLNELDNHIKEFLG